MAFIGLMRFWFHVANLFNFMSESTLLQKFVYSYIYLPREKYMLEIKSLVNKYIEERDY